MKKILTVLLAAALVFSMAACVRDPHNDSERSEKPHDESVTDTEPSISDITLPVIELEEIPD